MSSRPEARHRRPADVRVPAPRSAPVLLEGRRSVTVTREERHQDVLAGYGGRTVADLGFCTIDAGKYRGGRAVEVRLDGRRVGELTFRMSERYGHLVEAILAGGRVPTCAAEVSRDHRGIQIELLLPDESDLRVPAPRPPAPQPAPNPGPNAVPSAGPNRGPSTGPDAGPNAWPDAGPNAEPDAEPDAEAATVRFSQIRPDLQRPAVPVEVTGHRVDRTSVLPPSPQPDRTAVIPPSPLPDRTTVIPPSPAPGPTRARVGSRAVGPSMSPTPARPRRSRRPQWIAAGAVVAVLGTIWLASGSEEPTDVTASGTATATTAAVAPSTASTPVAPAPVTAAAPATAVPPVVVSRAPAPAPRTTEAPRRTAAPQAQAPAPAPRTQAAPSGGCDPHYSGACVPIAKDVDCQGGSGDGPAYVRGPVTVVGKDIYKLDSDGNGIGCE